MKEAVEVLMRWVAWQRYCDAHAGISRWQWEPYREEDWR